MLQKILLFTFTIVTALFVLFISISLFFLPMTLTALQVPEKIGEAMIVPIMILMAGANGFNFVITALAWWWEGRGEVKRGVKVLGIALLVEFLLLIALPTALRLSVPSY